MKKYICFFMPFLLLLLSSCFCGTIGTGEEITRTFPGKRTVCIQTISGNCKIVESDQDEITVHIANNYLPVDAFQAKFVERAHTLILLENFQGSAAGNALWTISVPENTAIVYVSTSGAFDVTHSTGNLAVHTSSGDISVANSSGSYALHSYSGNITADTITMTGPGSFSSASGTVSVRLAETTEFNLQLSSYSGDAILDYKGNPVQGHFELSARSDIGQIESTIPFDSEEVFVVSGQEYMRKSFTRGNAVPCVNIQTASGMAQFVE